MGSILSRLLGKTPKPPAAATKKQASSTAGDIFRGTVESSTAEPPPPLTAAQKLRKLSEKAAEATLQKDIKTILDAASDAAKLGQSSILVGGDLVLFGRAAVTTLDNDHTVSRLKAELEKLGFTVSCISAQRSYKTYRVSW